MTGQEEALLLWQMARGLRLPTPPREISAVRNSGCQEAEHQTSSVIRQVCAVNLTPLPPSQGLPPLIFLDIDQCGGQSDHSWLSLLAKMTSAMKLTPGLASLISFYGDDDSISKFLLEIATSPGICLIALGKHAGDVCSRVLERNHETNPGESNFMSIGGSESARFWVTIHHPRELIAHPDLKREVWLHLQEVVRRLRVLDADVFKR
jgi:hypothetical protein